MTALRQELFDLVRLLPEENISLALNYIRDNFLSQSSKKNSVHTDLKDFREKLAQKYDLKDNSAEIQASIDFIKSLHPLMNGCTANKSLDVLREERLSGKYA